MGEVPATQHFVLVHGTCHGAWCWYKTASLLKDSGFKVTAVDLCGSGLHPGNADSILSFEEYNKPLMDLLSTIPEDEKVILVGHSAGGLSITHATHVFGMKKISLCIYVTAIMLRNGIVSDQDRQAFPDLGDAVDFNFGLGPDRPPTSAIINPYLQRKFLYQCSPHEDSTLASMLLRPAPLMPLFSAKFEGANMGDVDLVKRVYIKMNKDEIMRPDVHQEMMIKSWPPDEVMFIDTDHSPFFSAPNELHHLLINASTMYCG
ncbi:methylesterase 17 isoform X1 [Amborella trichopoda]|uniref:AB hydrolase-1 domain-containing protein n=1 Tax=Amborella trichopoda TaxID=13333 RepID=W1PG59_AMBTC|nr:methylesterase 17 isoform X1 [Amborella trichopoda]ERN08992.1 hypothetical protein AMTR_s00153p00056390 [Amborella trichopoda]|eukprot:XP_020524677.1 methylesterase 17 isoform X1 [Amborella trichopoda]